MSQLFYDPHGKVLPIVSHADRTKMEQRVLTASDTDWLGARGDARLEWVPNRKRMLNFVPLGGGRFVIEFPRPDGGAMVAVGHPKARGSVDVSIGGESASFPARQVVDALQAARIAAVFMENGMPDADTRWESRGKEVDPRDCGLEPLA